MSDPQPSNVRARREDGVLEVEWFGGGTSVYPFHFLRCQCPCAGCVDEFTGVRKLRPESVPEDVSVSEANFVGNYAIKIRWSDGHDTGLYTWDYLNRLRSSDAVTES